MPQTGYGWATASASHVSSVLLSLALTYGAVRYLFLPIMTELMNSPDPKEQQAKKAAREALLLHSQGSGRPLPLTNTYEERLITDLVFPSQIDTSFADIGGLDELKKSLYETVILPLQSPHLFQALHRGVGGKASPLLAAPKGVLFYGPPGTGKTMMARAMAKQCKATFLNLHVSTLQSKWFGESQKMTKAIFTLATKLAPTIVFIDEVDLFLRRRQSSDHEATSSMKGEFMQMWDGLLQDSSHGVMVLGATNRPYDLDDACLRRMPRQFCFDLPSVSERCEILRVMLREVRVDDDVELLRVAKETEGYSSSDLKELCRYAVMMPIREVLEEKKAMDWGLRAGQEEAEEVKAEVEEAVKEVEAKQGEELVRPAGVEGVRSVRLGDFFHALSVVEPTGRESMAYLAEFTKREHSKRHRAAANASATQPERSVESAD